MTNSAAAFIEALLRRWRLSAHRMRAPGQFPEGWQQWLESMAPRPGAVTGARPGDIVAVMAAREPLPPPGRAALLNQWQAFSTLWRQQWHPAPREERWVRWGAAVFSVLLNLFFAGALIWLMYLQFLGLEPPPQGETVVQVEFVGEGTPGEVGGGDAPDSPRDTPAEPESGPANGQPQDVAAEPSPEAAPALAETEVPELPEVAVDSQVPPAVLTGQPVQIPERDVPVPSVPAAPQQQAVAVSEPTPDTTEVFVLPPTRSVAVSPRVSTRDLQADTLQVQEREVTAPVSAPSRAISPDTPAVRPLATRTPQVAERDVTAPVQAPVPRDVQVRTPAVRELSAPPQAIRERDVRTPAPRATPGATAATQSATPSTAPATSTAARPASASPATSPGAGPKAEPAPGTWATQARADDWGASARNTPGGQRGVAPGVFNADGSVRLGDAPGSAAPGMPPGTVTQEIANLDRAGTWLKRKPTGFEATSFDKYWVPNETLLAEWVRKSIKEVVIPIPGTSKRIHCAVALLALGGACGLSDANLNEQPAQARPPPDIPFKPHLQEDNGSIKSGSPPGS